MSLLSHHSSSLWKKKSSVTFDGYFYLEFMFCSMPEENNGPSGADFEGDDLSDTNLTKKDLCGANLRDADIRSSYLK